MVQCDTELEKNKSTTLFADQIHMTALNTVSLSASRCFAHHDTNTLPYYGTASVSIGFNLCSFCSETSWWKGAQYQQTMIYRIVSMHITNAAMYYVFALKVFLRIQYNLENLCNRPYSLRTSNKNTVGFFELMIVVIVDSLLWTRNNRVVYTLIGIDSDPGPFY